MSIKWEQLVLHGFSATMASSASKYKDMWKKLTYVIVLFYWHMASCDGAFVRSRIAQGSDPYMYIRIPT